MLFRMDIINLNNKMTTGHFEGMVKFGGKLVFTDTGYKLDKKFIGWLPDWEELKTSKFNGEKDFCVLTGKINDIFVIDLDRTNEEKKAFLQTQDWDDVFESQAWFENNFGKISEVKTLVTQSRNGGYHVYFKYTDKISNKQPMGGLRIDLLSDKSCCFEGQNYTTYKTYPIRALSESEIGAILKMENKQPNKKQQRKHMILSTKDQQIIMKFVQEYYHHSKSIIRDIKIDTQRIVVALNEKECEFIGREHSSNNQYIIIDGKSSKQKCHDSDCESKMHNEIKVKDYPKELYLMLKKYIEIKEDVSIVINEHYTERYKEGEIVEIKYKNNVLAGKIKNNKNLKVDHFKHTEHCKGELFYNVNLGNIKDQIITLISCKKCGYVHSKEECMNNPVYQLILNNYDNRNELTLCIKEEKHLQIIENPVLNRMLYKSLSQEDDYICEMLYETFKDKYLLIHTQWYMYNGTVWTIVKDETYPIELLCSIKTIREQIRDLYTRHQQEQNLSTDEMRLLARISDNLAKKLAKNNEDVSYVTASKKYFAKPGLKFDEKRHLLAFQNGVYDLNSHIFRQGSPYDYLSVQQEYDYREVIDVDKMALVEGFFDQILDREVKDYLLMNIALCLTGKENKEQEFYILTGRKGANGKSVLGNFTKATFGAFFCAPEPTLITKAREKANEANEALKDLKGKRIAFMSEPNKRDRILSDNMKKFTGGNPITMRGNHQSSEMIKLDLKFFMETNGIPLLDDCNEAEIRRLSIFPFPYKFCDNPTKKNEKQIDLNIGAKLLECRSEYIHLLIRYLKQYESYEISGRKLPKPKEVVKQIDMYIQKNKSDVDANEFIEEYLEFSEDNEDKVHCKDVWTAFCEWCISQSKRKIKQGELEELIEYQLDIDVKTRVRIKEKQSWGWTNIKVKEVV